DQLKAAKTQTFKLDRTMIKFEDQFEKLCYKCEQSRHITFQCEKVRVQRDKALAQARFASIQSRFRKGPEKEASISYTEILRKRSRSRSVYNKERRGEQEGIRERLDSTDEQQMHYQDAEEMCRKEKETPLATYKAINKKVVERQDKLKRQIKQIEKILSELLENGQLSPSKKRQQHERQ
ncbi:7823_t:CDS:2, partial [Acaulospora morrowiae]